MVLKVLLRVALCMGVAGGAMAQQMNDAERQEFRAEIRDYLLEHPEVLMEAIGVLEQRDRTAQLEADRQLARTYADALANDGYSFVGGNPDGDVTLIEFMDYRCGFCRRSFPEIEQLIALDGNIRFVIKEFPILGAQSVLASRFAIATQLVEGDAAYKDVHDALMTLNADLTMPVLARLGEGLALNVEAIVAEMESPAVNERISQTRQLAQAMQITGTPTLIFEDQVLRGYVPLAQMQQIASGLRSDG